MSDIAPAPNSLAFLLPSLHFVRLASIAVSVGVFAVCFAICMAPNPGDDMIRILLALAVMLALPSRSMAEERGDAMKGETVARTVCAQCHEVRQGHFRSRDPMAPNFTAVATTLGMTDIALRVWLQSSHPTMPNFILTPKDRDDVIAYILSLKSRQ